LANATELLAANSNPTARGSGETSWTKSDPDSPALRKADDGLFHHDLAVEGFVVRATMAFVGEAYSDRRVQS
jgi:hypothetical protein